jgi:hypothetical protein
MESSRLVGVSAETVPAVVCRSKRTWTGSAVVEVPSKKMPQPRILTRWLVAAMSWTSVLIVAAESAISAVVACP